MRQLLTIFGFVRVVPAVILVVAVFGLCDAAIVVALELTVLGADALGREGVDLARLKKKS